MEYRPLCADFGTNHVQTYVYTISELSKLSSLLYNLNSILSLYKGEIEVKF